MNVQPAWLWRGYFDFSGQDPRQTTTIQVRERLATKLGIAPSAIKIRQFPVGPVHRHTFWWGTGALDYAEAQFFARIAKQHAILSLGISVEKGFENAKVVSKAKRSTYLMNRSTWDWPRLVKHAETILSKDIPSLGSTRLRQIFLRVEAEHRVLQKGSPKPETVLEPRTFVFSDGQWFERYVGKGHIKDIADYLASLDVKHDWWVNLYIATDLTPAEVDGLTPSGISELLLLFKGIRDRLRK